MGIISVTIPPVAANPNGGGGGGGASKFVQLTDVTPAADNSGKFLSEVAPVNGERRFEFLPLTTANVAGLSAALGNVSSTISALSDEIAAESVARAAGDAQAAELAGAALTQAIATESQSRIAGDANALQIAKDYADAGDLINADAIAAESLARASADSLLNNAISAESATRADADANLQTALDGKAATNHNHAIADVTNLQTALDGKAATNHNHAIADVTNLQSTLDAKELTANKAASLATPDDTKYPTTQAVATGLAAKQNTITLGSVAQYLRGDLSLSNFASDVLSTALSGLVFTTNAAITATDTVLQAFGKLQAQVDKRLRFDAAQTLTAAEQTQMRTNMGTAAGLQFFDEAAVENSSRTLKPKLFGAESAGNNIILRLIANNLGGLITDAVASVGIRSIDLQLARSNTSNSVTAVGSTAIGRGWKISGIDNTGIGQILSGLITITGQKNTVFGATGPFGTSGIATISGDYNTILSAEIPSVSGTFNWIFANTYGGINDYTKNNSIIIGALPINQANNVVVLGNRFSQFNSRYMENAYAEMVGITDSAVVKLRTTRVQHSPVMGTFYDLISSGSTLAAQSATTQNAYVVLSTVSNKSFFEALVATHINSSGGLIAHRSFKVTGVFDNSPNGSLKYTVAQVGDNSNGESLLDTDIEVRVVVNAGRVVVQGRTQNARATILNLASLMTVSEVIIAS